MCIRDRFSSQWYIVFVDFLFSICLLVVFSCSQLAFEYTWDCETGYSAHSSLMTAHDAKMSHDTGKQWACICMNPSGVGSENDTFWPLWSCHDLSLLCVYLHSVSSPLHLAGFLRLALLSVLFICILLVLLHCKHFCHFKHFVLVSSSLELHCSFQFNFLIFYLFSCLGLYFVVSSLSILSFLSLLQFAIYFVLP